MDQLSQVKKIFHQRYVKDQVLPRVVEYIHSKKNNSRNLTTLTILIKNIYFPEPTNLTHEELALIPGLFRLRLVFNANNLTKPVVKNDHLDRDIMNSDMEMYDIIQYSMDDYENEQIQKAIARSVDDYDDLQLQKFMTNYCNTQNTIAKSLDDYDDMKIQKAITSFSNYQDDPQMQLAIAQSIDDFNNKVTYHQQSQMQEVIQELDDYKDSHMANNDDTLIDYQDLHMTCDDDTSIDYQDSHMANNDDTLVDHQDSHMDSDDNTLIDYQDLHMDSDVDTLIDYQDLHMDSDDNTLIDYQDLYITNDNAHVHRMYSENDLSIDYQDKKEDDTILETKDVNNDIHVCIDLRVYGPDPEQPIYINEQPYYFNLLQINKVKKEWEKVKPGSTTVQEIEFLKSMAEDIKHMK